MNNQSDIELLKSEIELLKAEMERLGTMLEIEKKGSAIVRGATNKMVNDVYAWLDKFNSEFRKLWLAHDFNESRWRNNRDLVGGLLEKVMPKALADFWEIDKHIYSNKELRDRYNLCPGQTGERIYKKKK